MAARPRIRDFRFPPLAPLLTVLRVGASLILLGFFSSPGPAADHRVKVEAMSHPLPTASQPYSFWIVSGNPAIAETSLRFWDASRHIQTALSAHGLFAARDQKSAGLLVTIDFGMRPGPPKYERTLLPVYGGDLGIPIVNPADPRGSWTRSADFTRLLGYEEIRLPVESHEKFLYFSATENQPAAEGRAPATVWRVVASIEDERSDLRSDLPVLAAVVMQSLGHETNGPALVRIGDRSPAVAFIKKGL